MRKSKFIPCQEFEQIYNSQNTTIFGKMVDPSLQSDKKIVRNCIIAHETKLAYLIKLKSNKKTAWFSKKSIRFIDKKVNSMTGHIVYEVEFNEKMFEEKFE